MAIPGGTLDSYAAIGNREDLSDMIYDVSPSDTPVFSMCGRSKATNTIHEWQTDALRASADNKALEGDDAGTAVMSTTTRLNNICQIMTETAYVSGTQQDGMNPAGRKKEMAYQISKKMKEIKLDAEKAIIGLGNDGNPKVAGNASTEREMADIYTYLVSNVELGAGRTAPTGDGTDGITGAPANTALTEAKLTAVCQDLFNNGGNPNTLVCSAAHKAVISGFAGNATRYVSTDDKKLVTSIDVYVGDFHSLKIVPSREIATQNVLLLDAQYLAVAEMRGLHSYDLGKSGDNYKKHMVWEWTLEVKNEAAHGLIADNTP